MATACIDPGALRHNLSVVRQYAVNSRVMAVIKANGYGHGMIRVARALEDADAFAVAQLAEAFALRDAGIGRRVLAIHGAFEPDDLKRAAAQQIDIAVQHPDQWPLIRDVALSAPVRVWLKLDTGMHRLGLAPDDALALFEQMRTASNVASVDWMTHFANADVPEDTYTQRQISRFVSALGERPGARSMANSAAILSRPDSHADWVRPGIMLYGVSPLVGHVGSDHGLKPAMSLKAPILSVREIAAGEPVGYSGLWKAPRPTRIGVVAIGYGDGYSRHAPTGTPVLVNGQAARLIGRVSMDSIGVDLTGIAAKVGDTALLWGPQLPVEEVARHMRTIGYDCLAGLTGRVWHAADGAL